VFRLSDMPIRRKLSLAAMVPCAVGLLCATVLLVQRNTARMQTENEKEVSVLGRIIADTSSAAVAFGDAATARESLAALAVHPAVLSARLESSDGRVFADYRPPAAGEVEAAPIRPDGLYNSDDELVVFVPVEQKGHRLGTLIVQFSLAGLGKQRRQALALGAGVLVGSLGVAFVMSMGIQRVISRPILRLAATTRRVWESADYSVRAERAGDDEVGFLIDSFNSMLGRIESRERELAGSRRELEQIIYVTSHDLRSPLVNIQGFSVELKHTYDDLLARLRGDPAGQGSDVSQLITEELPQILGFIQRSALKMEKLLAGLLRLSRSGRTMLDLRELDMNSLMGNVLSEFEFVAKAKGISLTAGNLSPCFGDEVQLNQAFSNLISNAIKYLDPHRRGAIHVSGTRDGEREVYCVEDNGIGIPEPHQGRIFEVFHRLDPDASEGEGLGLTIVRKSVERQNGRIWLESEPGKGTRFFVAMPVSAYRILDVPVTEALRP
jgi:signal transduction histidine kinase